MSHFNLEPARFSDEGGTYLAPALAAGRVAASTIGGVGTASFLAGATLYQACHPQDCGERLKAIYDAMNEVEGRLRDLYFDELNLKVVAPCKPSPSLKKGTGSWNGHIQQLENQQTRLKTRSRML